MLINSRYIVVELKRLIALQRSQQIVSSYSAASYCLYTTILNLTKQSTGCLVMISVALSVSNVDGRLKNSNANTSVTIAKRSSKCARRLP